MRTRFAPSPTGALHSGVVRTALFSWLLAQQSNGQFILRIEDTDQKREVEGGVGNIKETLRWLGLEWQEGPDVGGPYAPYLQSQRLEKYKQVAEELIAKGLAYADPYTPEELQAFREKAQVEKRPFLYRDHRPESPPKWDGSQALRVKLEPKDWSWDDAIMGKVSMGPEMIDDFIIIKADGFPTYNFAHIVDDHEMKITHILRSQEFLSSIPKFLATHEILNWDSPVNATAPQVMDETGRRKLSKRHGAKPVLEYREMGFLPDAIVNFLALIGWNDGTDQEIYSRQELIEKFSLDRVQKSGGIFDERRLVWFNGHYIRKLSLDELYRLSEKFWPESAKAYDDNYRRAVLELFHERLKFLSELPELTGYFFSDPKIDIEKLTDSQTDETAARKFVEATIAELGESDFSEADLEQRMRGLVDRLATKPGALFKVIRMGVTGSTVAPGLFETLHVIGKERTLDRLKAL
ncbi:MAG TPA: glutamate--tRNA ligase [Candidatus Saccharimonadales bacterium]|nr:glutamate--tRNA ligase [Candidatus Saccharimonadales bacterium]